MWCRPCNIETNQNECPRCGNKTEVEVPVQVKEPVLTDYPMLVTINYPKNEGSEIYRYEIVHLVDKLDFIFEMYTAFELKQIEQSCGKEDFLEIKIFEDGSRGGYRHEVKLGEKLFYSGGPH